MSDQPIAVRFIAEESAVADYVSEIEKGGGKIEVAAQAWEIPADLIDDYSDPQFEPMMLIAATVAAGFLIKRISDVWMDHKWPGGQVIDARNEEIEFRIAPYLKPGTLVILTKEGEKVFQLQDKDEALPLLEKIIKAHG